MSEGVLRNLIEAVPGGRWGVGVSGGADSVALLLLATQRAGLSPHVIHLDHETRRGGSGDDAQFVTKLAERLGVPATIELRSTVEIGMVKPANNPSSRYRNARIALFARVAETQNLQGVLLAHHADDQAETVLLRLLRGNAAANLGGIKLDSQVGSLRILRPLLSASRDQLREFLNAAGQTWREDASNQSAEYQRNVIRRWLSGRSKFRNALLELERASDQLRQWLDVASSDLPDSFPLDSLRNLPPPVARHTACRWLISHGAPPPQVSQQTCGLLVRMCVDAASPPRQHFPGNLLVTRKGGQKGVISLSVR